MKLGILFRDGKVLSHISVLAKLTVTLVSIFLAGCNVKVHQSDGGSVSHSQLGGLSARGTCEVGVETCSYRFNAPVPVSFSAQPAPGYRFMGWFGSCSGDEGCSVTLDTEIWGSKHVRAEFLPESVAAVLDSLALDNTWIELCIGRSMVEQDVATPEEVDTAVCRGPGYGEEPALESLSGLEALPNLVDLEIRKGSCYLIDANGCGFFGCYACPTDLRLNDLSALEQLNNLESLSINNSSLGALDSVSEQSSITQISFSSVAIDDLNLLDRFSALNSFSIVFSPDPNHYVQIAGLEQLTSLILRDSSVREIEIEQLVFPPNLESLRLRHFAYVDLNSFTPSSVLTELSLAPAYDLASMQGVENFPNLESVTIGYAEYTLDVEPLLLLPNLTQLHLDSHGPFEFYGSDFQIPGVKDLRVMGSLQAIPPFVLNASGIEVLDLSSNLLTDVDPLQPGTFPELTDLNLAANQLASVASLHSFQGSALTRLELSNARNSETSIDCAELEQLIDVLDTTSVEGGALADCGLD